MQRTFRKIWLTLSSSRRRMITGGPNIRQLWERFNNCCQKSTALTNFWIPIMPMLKCAWINPCIKICTSERDWKMCRISQQRSLNTNVKSKNFIPWMKDYKNNWMVVQGLMEKMSIDSEILTKKTEITKCWLRAWRILSIKLKNPWTWPRQATVLRLKNWERGIIQFLNYRPGLLPSRENSQIPKTSLQT